MLDWLISVDSALFVFVNSDLANPVFDAVMPIATNHWFLRGVFVLILLWLLIFGKKQGRITALGCILVVALADQLTSGLIKPLVERIRPCHVIEPVHLLVDCSQGLSFPSSHAANSVSLAVYLSFHYPRAVWFLVAFAVIVSYSRIAVGVHYPLDVIVGAIVGAMCGASVLLVHSWVGKKYPSLRKTQTPR